MAAAAENGPLAEFPSRVQRFTLENGLRVLVVERPVAPVVSFSMTIRTGALDEEDGRTGLAHMFEHMLFKGSKTIGTRDYEAEAPLLDEIDRAAAALQSEKDRGAAADPDALEALAAALEELQARHQALVVDEEFWRIYEQAGGRGLNAGTGYDFTTYVVSLPANRLELYMRLEADRIKNPVLREFYKERDVVMEERRMRVDNSPGGRLWEAFLGTAFIAHPYRRPILGWESDITRMTRADAERFFAEHYDVSRLVLAVVGGVDAAEVERLARRYLEPIPSRTAAAPGTAQPQTGGRWITAEPPQQGTRRVEVVFDAEPSVVIGFHRPDMLHPDAAALDVAAQVLSHGRTARYYDRLVRKRRVAVSAWASASAPGQREPHLFVLGGAPRHPHTAGDLERALLSEMDLLTREGPKEWELEKIKTNMEASLIRGLDSNGGLAGQLSYYEAVGGDWEILLARVSQVRAVTAEDVRRVMEQYLRSEGMTVGTLVKPQ